MEIVVDGIIYQMQAHGGINRLYSEVLPRLCDLEPSLRIRLLLGGDPKGNPPQHTRIEIRRFDRYSRRLPGSLAQVVMAATRLLDYAVLPRSIAHSTYYSAPHLHRGPKFLTIYDFVHEALPDIFSGPRDDRFRSLKRSLALSADHIIAISHAVAKEVTERYGVPELKVHPIPLACDPFFCVMQGDIDPRPVEGPFILYVGSRQRYKNAEVVIRAFAQWKHHQEVRLVFAGGGNLTADELELLRSLHIERDVVHLPSPSDMVLRQLYNQALAFIYPSRAEGFGIPLLEAFACGCPVVASRIPTSVEVAGDLAQFFDPVGPQAAEGLCDALDQALVAGRDPARVAARVQRANSFSWDRTARAFLDVYRLAW